MDSLELSIAMHILQLVSSSTWRGGENQTFLLCQGLQSRKISFTVAAPNPSQFREKCPHFEYINYPTWNPFSLLQFLLWLWKSPITHIDAHSSHAHSLGLLAKIFFPRIQLIVHRRVDNLPNNAWKYQTSLVDQYVPISQAIQGILEKQGIPKEKITTVRSATDITPFENSTDNMRKQLPNADALDLQETIFIGSTAALTPQKGIDILIRAVPEVIQHVPHARFYIAGQGHLEQELHKLRKDLNVEEYIHFIGWVEDVPRFLNSLDIFILPSNNEGLGTSLLDALSSQLCTIATEVGGIPEIIQHEINGMLVPRKDPHSLAQTVIQCCQNPDLRQQLGQSGLKSIKENFSVTRMIDHNIAVYQHL